MRFRCLGLAAALFAALSLAINFFTMKFFRFLTMQGFFAWQGTDEEYALSVDFLRHRMLNQAWVSQTGGLNRPEQAAHWNDMPLIGQTHLHLTRFLHLVSKEAEKNHVRWSLGNGALLGYVRHGDFIPHDHDVDVIVDERDMELMYDSLKASLPDDIILSPTELNITRLHDDSRAGEDVFMFKLHLLVDGHSSCCFDPRSPSSLPLSRPCLFLDIWAYDASRGDFSWIQVPPRFNLIEGRRRVQFGPSVAYIPANVAEILSLQMCWNEDVRLRNVRDARTGHLLFESLRRECHGFMRYLPRPSEVRKQSRGSSMAPCN